GGAGARSDMAASAGVGAPGLLPAATLTGSSARVCVRTAPKLPRMQRISGRGPSRVRTLPGVAELGLFPLPLVLVPTERIPLHIFEPRYRELVGDCVDRDEEFGIVLLQPNGEIHDVGTRAAVTEVLQVLPDGRMNIIVAGGDRFRLLEVDHEHAYA